MSGELSRARACLQQGQLEQAARLADMAIRAAPRNPDAIILRAYVAIESNQPSDALGWLRKASKLAPQLEAVQCSVGIGYLKLGLVDDALRRFQAAAALNPAFADAHLQLGRIYLDHRKQPSAAAQALRDALKNDEQQIDATYHLAKALFQLGDVDQSVALFRRACELAESGARPDVAALCRQSIAVAIPGAPAADNAAILSARAQWVATLEDSVVTAATATTRHSIQQHRNPDRPLVIGYVSSFFDRENWMKPVWGLLNEHNRDQFQVRIFSFGPLPGGEHPGSATDSAWRPHDSDRVFDVAGLSNEALAGVIADEQVDVLVDLNGYSDPPRLHLFMQRPAPVVIGWFNMYATTGMSCYDCLIADDHVVLPAEERHYSEPIVRVPGTYLTFRVGYPVPDVEVPPAAAAGRITFGSLCSRYKLTPPVIAAWSQILRRCPTARLLLRNAGLESDAERQFLIADFGRQGVAPERLELLGRAPHFEFLETYGRIDIALDTFPYNGGTTTTESIWQGVPVVAFAGTTWPSRTSATLLREAGLADWVATDQQEYVESAVRRATAPDAAHDLAELRSTMRSRVGRSSACATERFARAMESIYRERWRRWRSRGA